MTKLKNTKKGMAKKALSISLVAAMLATSNVPVWAAEFSDGEVAAFTSEVEAPVVEEAETTNEILTAEDENLAEDTTTSMNFDNLSLSDSIVKYNATTTLTGSILKADNKKLQSFNYELKVGNKVLASGEVNGNGDVNQTITLNGVRGDAFKKVNLHVYRNDASINFNKTINGVLTLAGDIDQYFNKNITIPGYIKTGTPLSYTGEVKGLHDASVTLKWYNEDGEEILAGSEGLYWADADGTYTLKATIAAPGIETFEVEVGTTTAGKDIPAESITGSVSISNDAQNQWGYKAKAEYNAQLPENVSVAYEWQTLNTKDNGEEVWEATAESENSKEYTIQEEDCGKELRVVATFTRMDNKNEVIITKESNSFKVAPLQINGEEITYDAEKNFGIDKDNNVPKANHVYVTKKNPDGKFQLAINKRELTLDKDYTLVTQNTDNPGIRTVTIKLIGVFTGELTEKVNIGEFDLKDCKVTLENKYVPFVGDGKYAAPVVKEVKWANRYVLTEGKDYVINEEKLKECVNAGTYHLELEGRGDFTNTTNNTAEFTIVARSMENCKVVWTGKPVIKGEPLVAGVDVRDTEKTHFVVVDNKGYVLIPNKDYTYDKEGIWEVSQQKCKVVVEATAKEDTVNHVYTGGNYYGKAESDYVTVGTNLETYLTKYVESVVSAQDYTGKTITFDKLHKISAEAVAEAADVAVNKVGFSDDLEVGVDFDITYKNNVDAYLLKDAKGELLAGTARDTANGAIHYSQTGNSGKDSDIENDDPQAPQVYLTFKGKFSGKTTPVRFAINQVELNAKDTTTKNTVIFNAAATDVNAMTAYADQIEAIQFKDMRGNTLKNTVDYTYDHYYVNDTKDVSTEKGYFNMDLTAHTSKVMNGNIRETVYDGNYYGGFTYKADIIAKSLTAKDITVADIANQKYNGKLIEPKVTVKDGDYTLVEGTDYELSYKNNRSAGTATVIITGLTAKERYTDSVSKTFTIENKSIADAKIMKSGVYNYAYTDLSKYKASDFVVNSSLYDNDRAVKAEFDVVDANNNLLKEGYDYTVAYKNNTKVGTATIIITGKGDYEGTLEGTFEILGKGISGHFVEEKIPAQTYTGEEIKPEVTFVPDSPNLVLGKDYEIIYEYNVNPGKCEDAANVDDKGPKAVAHGIGDYAGYVKIGFEIKKADISVANVTAEDAVYAGGKIAEAKITVTNPASGKALIEGTDYSVEYVSGKEVGDTGKAILTLLNNKCYTFSGDSSNNATIVVTYNIVAKDLKDITVDEIADQTVTGEQIKPTLTVKNGDVVMREGLDYQVAYGENKEIGVGTATITPVDGNKNYTGSKEVTFNIVPEKELVGKAMITEVNVTGNMATVVLDGAVDNAIGYDYVISTENDYKNGRLPNGINKNQLITTTNYRYLPEGTYYAYCHAYKRGEDGKKVFGAWSNIFKFEVTATTPATPTVTSVKVSGSTVTVTYTNCKDATGYDVVLGKNAKRVYNEMRPTNYGSYVAKAYKNGTVKVTFKNVAKGTYYAGLHAYNRTSEDGKKVFSPWSNIKKITVK